ncbi:MAG: hypothetical protein H5U20_02200 [Rhodobacteraceae bacterium]|nr:hypothetical protein [Paracoccaceae bacterium]
MADITNELLLEHLKRIQERLGRLDDGQRDIMGELRSHKTILATLLADDAAQDGRIADLANRMERIERRLELRDEA